MDADRLKLAREIVREHLDYPALLDQIADEEDLVNAGVNSGEIIRVALGCEQELDRPLTDIELSRITSVLSVAELLEQEAARAGAADVQPADARPADARATDGRPADAQAGADQVAGAGLDAGGGGGGGLGAGAGAGQAAGAGLSAGAGQAAGAGAGPVSEAEA